MQSSGADGVVLENKPAENEVIPANVDVGNHVKDTGNQLADNGNPAAFSSSTAQKSWR